MPWKETCVMNQRTEFVLRVLQGVEPFGQLCREYGISRKTGYKWKQRFFEQGLDGLGNRSRRPKASPSQLDENTVCQIVKLKRDHPTWGPKKIRELFTRVNRTVDVPSLSSFKRVLDKAGLVQHRRRRKPNEQGRRIENRTKAERPNHVWTIDFKGWWYTQDRSRFEPLTIRDDYSRYVLYAQSVENSRSDTIRRHFNDVFEKYGLPEVIRSDNGTPFAASQAPLGLSRLSAWWLTLGIDLDRIPPGRPDQNGGHERMHRDMAIELENTAELDVTTQQASLDVWRRTFNHERPHEAIGMRVPAELYERSKRHYEPNHVELVYPTDHLVRKVARNGAIKIANMAIPISTALCGYEIGLQPITHVRMSTWFCRLCLGEIDLSTAKFHSTAIA